MTAHLENRALKNGGLENYEEVRQLVDKSAAIWAGLIAGIVFLLLYLFVAPRVLGGDALTLLQYQASIVLGPESALTATNIIILVVALIVHFALAIVWSLIIATIIHRWGMVVGILLGGLLGLAIYGINFFSFIALFPWFWPLNTVFTALVHVIFGAVAGGVYEFLEVEYYVPIND